MFINIWESLTKNGVTQMFDIVFRSLTMMLIVVSFYTIMTTFPRLVAIAMNPTSSYTRDSVHDYYFLRWARDIIAPWNYCGNFFFYVLSGKQFRQEILQIFCCRKRLSGTFDLYESFL